MRDFLGIMISRTSFTSSLHIFVGRWVCDNQQTEIRRYQLMEGGTNL